MIFDETEFPGVAGLEEQSGDQTDQSYESERHSLSSNYSDTILEMNEFENISGGMDLEDNEYDGGNDDSPELHNI